ncbi:MAG TPA: nodulation protein NfeD [Candidatus Binatia bacterium]|nr:nodulation protein NfeD [Candidatus Binatia bacterium]
MRWLGIMLTHISIGQALCLGAAEVGLIHIKGPIGPATADFIKRATKLAGERKYECLIVQLDTPGGLLDSTKEIVQAFYTSTTPTVVYVAPAGATATSAGTFITLAADVAAMAPSTTIGAAHPVSIGGGGGPQQTDSVMKEKMENYAMSFAESIAVRRKRNVEWAKAAVKESASITAEEALKTNVIDMIAKDLPELLREINGRTVNDRKLQTASAEVREIPMIARERVFQIFWRPEVMFILMLVAMYGIIGELSHPGAIVPGVVGVIALIVVLYMAAVLPVNLAGVLLIVLAMGCFIAELFVPSYGALTVGGLAAFLMGALMLFNRAAPSFRLSLSFIIPAAVMTAAFFLFVIGAGLRAQFRPVRVGLETWVGKTTTASTAIDSQGGKVFVDGEIWQAVSDVPVAQGESVEIVGAEGLTLLVKPKTTNRGG